MLSFLRAKAWLLIIGISLWDYVEAKVRTFICFRYNFHWNALTLVSTPGESKIVGGLLKASLDIHDVGPDSDVL